MRGKKGMGRAVGVSSGQAPEIRREGCGREEGAVGEGKGTAEAEREQERGVCRYPEKRPPSENTHMCTHAHTHKDTVASAYCVSNPIGSN